LKINRHFLTGFLLLLCISVYVIITFTGCGALAALISAVFGSQGGFVFVPFLSDDKLSSEQSGTYTGMVVLYSNNPPPGYHAAEGAVVTIDGVKGTTDGKGYFYLSGLPAGLNSLTVEYGSFVSTEQPVMIPDPNGSTASFSNFNVIPERLLCPPGRGGTYQFGVYASDCNGNPVIPSATWSVEGDIGTVSSTGIFTATKSGTGKVVAVNGTFRSEASITVTDSSGTVKGDVTCNGIGMSGVKVKAENFTNYAVTDSSGHYVLPGIPSNPVTLIATGTDGKTGTGYGVVPAGGEVEVNIVLTGSVATATPVITPGDIPRGNIGGKVVEYDGTTPIGGAFVVFYSYSYPSGSSLEGSSVPLKTVTADMGGNFLFTGVPQGACRIEFWRNESEYNASPSSPFGAVNDVVTAEGKTISVRPLVEPTATATVTPTVTPTAIATATPTQAGPPMVSLPGGTFDMGSAYSEYEFPVHSVTVSSFNMFKYEVKNSDYVLFLNSEGNQTEGGVEWIDLTVSAQQGITGGPGAGTFSVVSGYENRPVVCVSWYGAVAYCNWLSSQQGLTPCYGPVNNRGNDPSVWRTWNGYRLPTEAEWEYACRAGSTAEYYWGDPYPPDPPNIGNYAWYDSNSGGNHHAVGQLLPNSFGLYDMSGNIREWCSDWSEAYSLGPFTNPTGPAAGSDRVYRGGSWNDTVIFCRSADRGGGLPDIRGSNIGFRPVRN